MPSRVESFRLAFESLRAQVDRFYLYLDGHADVPWPARGDRGVIPIRASVVPGLHASGKFLGLNLERENCLYVSSDDDIIYPQDYVAKLCEGIDVANGCAVVGYHGSTFLHPFLSYGQSREAYFFGARLEESRIVDVLGTGTMMLDTRALRFDVRRWAHPNMADLSLAMEAARARLQLKCLAREEGYLLPVSTEQDDSIYASVLKDDSRQTRLALELLSLRAELARESRLL